MMAEGMRVASLVSRTEQPLCIDDDDDDDDDGTIGEPERYS